MSVPILNRAKRPLVIAGPCSAESREQLLATCEALAREGCVDLFRAGIWKPRTLPGGFEGAGEEGLKWLSEAKARTGIPISTEVASARHVECALKYGVDVLWIGARTTVNPFLVQEIADVVAHSEVPVMIKNPMNPDVALWSGAVARLEQAGVDPSRIGLIHRGFSTGMHWRYRNDPMWHLVFDMQRRHPELPMLCDPSHICGCREWLSEVAQRAADLNFDGLIIESHCSPERALSDARQQVTPSDLGALVRSITWRSARSQNEEYLRLLARCRSEIDQLDAEIFDLLSRRMQVSDRIGDIKRQNDVVILQHGRWQEVVERILSRSEELQLSSEFLKKVLEAIHSESIDHQNKRMNR